MKWTILVLTAVLAVASPAHATDTNKVTVIEVKDPNSKPYPLKTCIVSEEKIGQMGKPVIAVYKGQEFDFCCKDCVKDFKKDPDKFMKKLAQAQKKAGAPKP